MLLTLLQVFTCINSFTLYYELLALLLFPYYGFSFAAGRSRIERWRKVWNVGQELLFTLDSAGLLAFYIMGRCILIKI